LRQAAEIETAPDFDPRPDELPSRIRVPGKKDSFNRFAGEVQKADMQPHF
jgi:hypothetical protein